jgi:chemotaxis signal transduction protein
MAIYSPVRSQRTNARKTEKTKQFITFRLRQEWFALPIATVQRVMPMGKVYGDPQGTGISLTSYQGQEILVVDVGKRIFGEVAIQKPAVVKSETNETRFLLIVQSDLDRVVGLPIDSTPALRRISESAFTPIPDKYISQGNVRCISSTTIQLNDHPPMFLLEAEQLVRALTER